jgi:hypothetical protein
MTQLDLIGPPADPRDKGLLIGYREGAKQHPSRFSSAMFDLEILDTATGAAVRCAWADEEAYRRSLDRPTVADRGVW